MSYPTIPYENNIYYHNGNPSITNFNCGTQFVYGVAGYKTIVCSVSDVTPSNARLPGEIHL